jgi:hypothetical protein
MCGKYKLYYTMQYDGSGDAERMNDAIEKMALKRRSN